MLPYVTYIITIFFFHFYLRECYKVNLVFPLFIYFIDLQMVRLDFAQKMKTWCKHGFKELGDFGGMGIGRTTSNVLHHSQFHVDPHQVHNYRY